MIPLTCEVAVDAPISDVLTYLVPIELKEAVKIGSSVNIPLGRRQASGVVTGFSRNAPNPEIKLKPISSVDNERPQLEAAQLKWAEFLSQYYLYPLGQVLSGFFPALAPAKKKRVSKRRGLFDLSQSDPSKAIAPNLTLEQLGVCEAIIPTLGTFSTHLIFGVTGSGKTEIYIRVIEEALARGKSAMVLVPEISLTPQLIERFAARFKDQVAVIHSHLTDRERTDQWWRAYTQTAKILIGARSALFCPIPNLGIIIVDEEHETSFKQDEKLKYNARDASIMRGKFENCTVILGSATPSLESWSNSQKGRYQLHRLKSRVEDRPLPEIVIVDLKAEKEKQSANHYPTSEKLPFWMSPQLYHELRINYQNKEQSALFLNRRGVAQSVVGANSNEAPQCPNCDICLTLHANHYLVCHYCDYGISYRDLLLQLNETELKPIGVGTEQIEKDLQDLFPSAVIARADRDEITRREDLEDLIFRTERGEVDFLVGTQMIAKGLDFPALTLVGIVLADVGFNLPDFRACERSFQLLCQVSGRPGRHKMPGRVLIQTLNPFHPSLNFVTQHDYESFANMEMIFREQLHYPPVWKMACIRFQGLDNEKVEASALRVSKWLKKWILSKAEWSETQVLGPAKAPLSKIRNQYRHHIIMKSPHPDAIRRLCHAVLDHLKTLDPGTKVLVDIDPQNLM